MNIVVGSAFRNSAGRQIKRYFQQVHALREHVGMGHSVRVIAAEGDSIDGTPHELVRTAQNLMLAIELVDVTHGKREFGSTEEPERMAVLSKVGNAILDTVTENDDVLVYVESDLIWDPHTIGSLIDIVMNDFGVDVVAPMVMAGNLFYDIWAFRKNGQRFSPFAPFHGGLQRHGLTQLDSAGSCLIMRSEVARNVRMHTGALVEWCNNARAKRYRIFAHSDFKVHHP